MFPREFSFCFYIIYAYICTCTRRHLKESVPWSNITWSEMGKQNVQAKEVHYKAPRSSLYFWSGRDGGTFVDCSEFAGALYEENAKQMVTIPDRSEGIVKVST